MANVGLYFGNYGNPELMLFKRSNGAWTQLGSAYAGQQRPELNEYET